MKRSKTILAMMAAMTFAILMTGCSTASAEQSDDHMDAGFSWVHDRTEPKVPCGAVRIVKEQEERAALAEQQAAEEAQEPEPEWEAAYYEETDYTPSQPAVVRGNPNGLNSFDGVYSFNDKTEKFYPESAGRHVNTDQWHEDEQGFYRTDEGYYVVASDEYEPGTVIDTSQGKAQVLDDGAGEGIVDFYVNW